MITAILNAAVQVMKSKRLLLCSSVYLPGRSSPRLKGGINVVA